LISGGARSRGRSKSSPRPQPSDVAAHTQPVLPIEFAQAKKAPNLRHVFVAQVEFVNIPRLHSDSVPRPMMIHAEMVDRITAGLAKGLFPAAAVAAVLGAA